jgi:hypothetical protein
MENITPAQRNKMALIDGLVLGVIYIIMTTAVNLMVGNMIVFYVMKAVAAILYYVIIGVMASRIKKANGGYIEFREIFGAVFIMVLIAGLMSYIYTYLYINTIDPQFMNKIKASTISFMEKYKNSDEEIEKSARKFDQQIAETKNFNLGNNIMNYFEMVVFDSLVCLLVCLIVKKPKPVLQ